VCVGNRVSAGDTPPCSVLQCVAVRCNVIFLVPHHHAASPLLTVCRQLSVRDIDNLCNRQQYASEHTQDRNEHRAKEDLEKV